MATLFQVTYPSGVTGTVTATNPSVGTNGTTAPTSSTEIGVIDTTTGFLTPLTGTSVGGNEALNVNITGSVAPAGVATSANQTNGNQKTQIVDGSGNVIASTTNALNVAVTQPLPAGANAIGSVSVSNFPATQPVSGTVTANIGTTGGLALDTTVSGLLTNTQLRATPVPISGTVTANAGTGTFAVSAASLPLPTGAATSANQTTEIASLSSIDGKLNSLGQKTSAASVPVVIASDQSAIAITGSVTTTNSANGNTGAAVPTQATQVGGSDGTNLRAIKVSATGVVSVDGSATTQPVSGTVAVSNFPATQPISGTVTANQGTSPWVENVSQFGGNAVVTGTGTSGVGIPRVTVASDSSITANAGTNLNTSALALETTAAKLTLTQGSTTSGQSGPLIQAAVTTAAPTYTTAQTSPLSMDTSGNLRVTGGGVAQGSTTSGQNGTLIQGAVTTAAPTYTTAQTSPVSLTTGGGVRSDLSTIAGTAAATGVGTPVNGLRVTQSTSTTATNSNVAGSASSVTILTSNANRLGASVFNDSTAILYLNLAGNTASTTNYTVQLTPNAYYEVPPAHIYTGTITGIWASATGNARVTELSA